MAANIGLASCWFADIMLFSNAQCRETDNNEYNSNTYLLRNMEISMGMIKERHYCQSKQLLDM